MTPAGNPAATDHETNLLHHRAGGRVTGGIRMIAHGVILTGAVGAGEATTGISDEAGERSSHGGSRCLGQNRKPKQNTNGILAPFLARRSHRTAGAVALSWPLSLRVS